jgi:glycerol-3-phosphate dehydrogenase
MAEKPNDILCRRVPIAMLNKEAGMALIEEAADIIAKERRWSSSQKKAEIEEAKRLM